MVILSHIKAVQFGFRVCSKSVDSKGNSGDPFTFTYQWGQAVYECGVTLTGGFDELATCDTIDITPDNCAPEYGLQISADDEPDTKNNGIDDVCISSIIVNGEEIEVTPQRIGDDVTDSGAPNRGLSASAIVNYRYYDLGDDAPETLAEAPILSQAVTDAAPICEDVPPLTWTGDDSQFDHSLFHHGGWDKCNEGEIIGGFQYLVKCQDQHINCLEDMRCVKPDIPTTVTFEDCYEEDIGQSFDSAGTVTCNDGYFVNGIWSTDADAGINYWERLYCCKYDENMIVVDVIDSTHSWDGCFDKNDVNKDGNDLWWCAVETTQFITGFTRSVSGVHGDHGVDSLEAATYRQIYLTATSGNQCQAVDVATFDWDVLTEQGLNVDSSVYFDQLTDVTFSIDEDDLSLNIEVTLPYIGRASADDMESPLFGVTYVLDFEDYDAHEDAINEPGTCQNRQDISYDGKDFVDDFWDYSYNPGTDVGSWNDVTNTGYLAYPPATPAIGSWTVAMDDDAPCGKLVYTGKFTWAELRGCKSYGGTEPYTSVANDDNWLNITGTFYINLVSPFWYNKDYEFYRVYQLLSQPFIIAVSKVVNVLGSTGINVMTMSVIAVYKEDEGPDSKLEHGTNAKDMYADFRLILLTECSDYMKLVIDDGMGVTFDGTNYGPNTQISGGDFQVNEVPENTDCLNNKGFICSQLWQIEALNIACTDEKGRDFSGNYALTFDPLCRDDIDTDLQTHCNEFITTKELDTNRIALSTNLVWKDEICDPQIFTVQFEASMTFYGDSTFATPVEDSHLYQVGEDTIFVQVDTAFPSDTLSVFDTQLIQVYICTFDPLNAPGATSTGPIDQNAGNFGCFISDEAVRDVEYDEYFYHIYQANADDTSMPTVEEFDFKDSYTDYVIPDEDTNIVRFSFTVPDEVARDELFIMAEIEVTLQEDLPRRRRMLLSSSSSSSEPTANQLQHFIKPIGINHGQEIINKQPQQEPRYNEPNNNYNPPQQYYPPQPISNPYQPVATPPSSFTINLSSPWIIALGGLLGLVLTFNIIFMTYRNCCDDNNGLSSSGRASFMRRRGGKKGKYSVVNVESEFDSEAQMIQNDDDESQ